MIEGQEITEAVVWIQCPHNPNVRHRLQRGEHSPYYECNCLGIELGAELREGDEIICEEVKGWKLSYHIIMKLGGKYH